MAQVVIRNIDDEAMRRLESRAARKGVSLEMAGAPCERLREGD